MLTEADTGYVVQALSFPSLPVPPLSPCCTFFLALGRHPVLSELEPPKSSSFAYLLVHLLSTLVSKDKVLHPCFPSARNRRFICALESRIRGIALEL